MVPVYFYAMPGIAKNNLNEQVHYELFMVGLKTILNTFVEKC